MKIGIYFTPNKVQGGVYQYSISILEAFYKIKDHRYIIISTSKDVPRKFYKSKRFEIVDLNTASRKFSLQVRDKLSNTLALVAPRLMNLLYRLKLFNLITPVNKFINRHIIRAFKDLNLDLIFYPTSSNLSFLTDVPAVVAIHDLQHRINPHFPEVSAGGRWEYREYSYKEICKKAFKVFSSSDVGREDIIKYYHPDPAKVISLRYLPPSYLDSEMSEKKARQVVKKLGLPGDFVFYPARFWPHKNHMNLIKSIYYLKKRGRKVNLVLTGAKEADFSSFSDVFSKIEKYGLNKQIFYLGYINYKELSAIYKCSRALVMPTFNATYHIPPLEAWVMGTPVITSDLRACRDQLGDAGLLVNPVDPRDIAQKIWKVYKDPGLRKTLVRKGEKRVRQWKFKYFTQTITEVLEDFEEVKKE